MNEFTAKNEQAFLDACGAIGGEPNAMIEPHKERYLVSEFRARVQRDVYRRKARYPSGMLRPRDQCVVPAAHSRRHASVKEWVDKMQTFYAK